MIQEAVYLLEKDSHAWVYHPRVAMLGMRGLCLVWRASGAVSIPEGPSAHYLWTDSGPKTIKSMGFETRVLKYWVLGCSEHENTWGARRISSCFAGPRGSELLKLREDVGKPVP